MTTEPFDDITVADLLNRLYAFRDLHEETTEKWRQYDLEIQMLIYDAQSIRQLRNLRAFSRS